MPWDTIFTVLLYLVQALLVSLGIAVSLKPPSNKKTIVIISIIVAVCAFVGICAGIGLQIVTKLDTQKQQAQHKIEMDEQKKLVEKINGELYQSHLAQEYIKGQNSALALLIGKSGGELTLAIKEMAQSSSQATIATNKQICSNTIDLAKRLHKFDYDRNIRMRQFSEQEFNAMKIAKSKEEHDRAWNQYSELTVQRINNDNYEFRSTLLGEAVYLRDELLKRLPPQPKLVRPIFAFEGTLAGPEPAGDVAIYLEALSRKLCPN